MNNPIEGLILIEGKEVSEDSLMISLGMAKQLVIGRVQFSDIGTDRIILSLYATSAAYFGTALLDFAQVSGVTKVVTLALQTPS